MADPPNPDPPRRLSRSDLRLRARAIRERWDVPAELISETLYQVQEILRTAGFERHIIAAARVVIEATKADLAADRLDHDKSKISAPSEPDLRDALLSRAEAILGARTEGPGPDGAGGQDT